jgi:hypothetical protein
MGRCCSLQRRRDVDLPASMQPHSVPATAQICVTCGTRWRSDFAQDQHNMIQVCLLLLGTAFGGGESCRSDRIDLSVRTQSTQKHGILRASPLFLFAPPCSVTAGVSKKERRWSGGGGRGASQPSRCEIHISMDIHYYYCLTTPGGTERCLGKCKHGNADRASRIKYWHLHR